MESSGQTLMTDLLGGGSKAVMDFLTGTRQDPRNTERFQQAGQGLVGFVRDEPSRMADQLQKSMEAAGRGDINAMADHLWFAVPFAGAAGLKMKEYLDKGDVSGAFTHAFGTLAPIASKPVARGTVEVAKTVGTFAPGVIPGAIEYARESAEVPIKIGPTKVKIPGPRIAATTATGVTTGTAMGAPFGLAGPGAVVGGTVGFLEPLVVGGVKGGRARLAASAKAAADAMRAEQAAKWRATYEQQKADILTRIRTEAGTPPPPEPPPAPGPPPAATARPTPAPEPAPAAPTPPTATMSPAARLRQEMGLQPGEFETPTTFDPPGLATAARKAQINRMARHMRESGITAAQADQLDPPALADLAKLAGAEGPLGKVAKEVKLRMQEFETEASETAKYQAAWDKLSKGERRAFFDDENSPPPAAPPAAPVVTTPAEANAELGKLYPAPEPVETPAPLTASQKRVKGLAEWLAEEPIGTDLVERLETDPGARLLLGEQSRRLGHRSIGPGEIPQIIEEVKRLRSEGVQPAARAKAAGRNLPSDASFNVVADPEEPGLWAVEVKKGSHRIGSMDLIERPDGLEVDLSHLNPEYRGRGYGKVMYLEAIKQARRLGKKYLTSASEFTEDAARVWRSLGGEQYIDQAGQPRWRLPVAAESPAPASKRTPALR